MRHLLTVGAIIGVAAVLFLVIAGRRRAFVQRRDRAERRRTHRAQQADWDREHPPETVYGRRQALGDQPPPTA
ncbi:hypothetical protein [uncultured Sphingomonas sp.]|uniref:hypothetical protein n=1 Tax=uncultured Sphingomonas sp. TaxID=158754 RepID=UPI0025D69615|nr:hypothetical protein [uncultured Sphingomonas sp.]